MNTTLGLLAGLTVLGLSASAFAQPALTPSVPEVESTNLPPPPPNHYLSVGVGLGAMDSIIMAGPAIEAGLQLGTSPVWAHAAIGGGSAGELFGAGSGTYARANAGLELRGCISRDRICAIAGADLGYVHGSFTGYDDLFGDDGGDTMNTTDTAIHPVALPRAGLDVGGPRWRYRWTLELPVALDGSNSRGGTLTGAVAYRW